MSGPAHATEGLQRLLNRIADQLSTVESRNTAALREMEERLDLLKSEAQTGRANQGHDPFLERIAEGIELVAQRIAEGGERTASAVSRPAVLPAGAGVPLPLRYSAAGVLPAGWRQIDAGRAIADARTVDPFDFAEADAVAAPCASSVREARADDEHARLDRARETTWESPARAPVDAVSGSRNPATQLSPPAAERAWIEDRLGEVAARIEHTLAEMRPDATFMALGQRLEELEHRVSSTLDQVARRSDVEALRVVEAHVTQLSGQLHDTHAQLSRLAAIESHLQAVAGRLSDECVAGLMDQASRANASMEQVATVAAERASERLAASDGRERTAARLDQLHEMLARFVHERHQAEGQTREALDTMQQALIRVLDRIDALEGTLQPPRAADDVPNGAPLWTMAQVPDSRDAGGDACRPKTEPEVRAAAVEYTPAGPKPEASAVRAAAEVPSGRDVQHSLERVRQELIADAKRAKLRAAGQALEEQRGAKRVPRPARPRGLFAPLQRIAQARAFGIPLGRLLAGLLVLLIVVVGASVLFGRRATGANPPAAPVTGAAEQPAAPGKSTTRPIGPPTQASTGEPTLPPGVMLHQPDAEPTREALERAAREQRMADASVRVGMAAVARASPAAVSPEAPDGSDQQGVTVSVPGDTRSKLELPPATVGPLSLRLAAANGDPSAEFAVASRLAEGKGTDQNLKDAVYWYQRSASRGLAMAQYRLATFFERGLGVKADSARARVWYGRAAEQGNVKAMHNLAVLSADRASASPDYPSAVRWFTKAAEHGLADSQFNLAVLYENGLGVSKDPSLAYTWFAIAAQSGDKDAARRRDEARRRLDPAELAIADEAVRLFNPQPSDALANDPIVAGEAWKLRQSAGAGG